MLSKANVKQRVAELEQQLLERSTLSAELVRDEVYKLLRFTPKQLLREDGTPIPLHELPDEVAACIASIDYETKSRAAGDAIKITKMRFWNRNQAMDTAARITGLLKDPRLVLDTNPVRELMERIGKNGSGLTYKPY